MHYAVKGYSYLIVCNEKQTYYLTSVDRIL